MTTASKQPTLRSQAHLQGTRNPRRKTHPCKRACLHPPCPSYISLCIFNLFIWGLTSTYGQTPNRIPLFSSPTLSQLQHQTQTPQPATFQRIDINQYSTQNQQRNNYNNNPILNSNNPIEQQNQLILQQQNQIANNRQQQILEAQEDIKNFEKEEEYNKYMAASQPYINSYAQLSKLNPDSFSITKALYLVENAFENNKFSYEQFANAIKLRADIVKQILKREGINPNNNVALNYGIQKLFSQANNYYNPKTKQTVTVQPFKYDFKDYKGEVDYRQQLVNKLLQTGKGQCHSMPLLYLAIAEQLGAKAYLSLAPEHSFIQFFNNQNDRLNFETTSGNIVNQNWMIQSGYINSAALKNNTFLDTLSQKQLMAHCLTDLLLEYQNKFGYNDFTNQIKEQVKKLDPNNLTARIIDENMTTQIALQQIRAAGSPPLKELPNYPNAYNAYLQMQASYKQTDDLGFQPMPKEAYQRWLKSIDKEKQKQETKEVQQKMQQEIQMLKKLKVKITFTPKG
jgi:Transglutaminase-like superfamily